MGEQHNFTMKKRNSKKESFFAQLFYSLIFSLHCENFIKNRSVVWLKWETNKRTTCRIRFNCQHLYLHEKIFEQAPQKGSRVAHPEKPRTEYSSCFTGIATPLVELLTMDGFSIASPGCKMSSWNSWNNNLRRWSPRTAGVDFHYFCSMAPTPSLDLKKDEVCARTIAPSASVEWYHYALITKIIVVVVVSCSTPSYNNVII